MCHQRCGCVRDCSWDQRADPEIKLARELPRSQWAAQGLVLQVNLVFESPHTVTPGTDVTIK